jgi:AraC-like DNA-binding protein
MFQRSEKGFYILPKKKKLSELFLYGQTLEPISLDVEGPHNYIVVQLYPFASRYLLDVAPQELNDECYDLLQIKYLDIECFRNQLVESTNLREQVEIISNLMRELIHSHNIYENDTIQKAISIIINSKGQIKIKELLTQLHVTERTFERNFKSYVGLSPKQFAKIIQFQSSLNQLTETKFQKLTDIGFNSGFTDQSHFIRTFKSYTGQTPSFYYENL